MRSYTPIDKRYNTKIKVYPNGLTKTTYCNTAIFTYPQDKKIIDTEPKKRFFKIKPDDSQPRKDNIKRAKDKIFDLVYCNDWANFVSVTFDPTKVDSFNAKVVIKKLNKWLDNCVQRKGLRYILVAELHKSGRIHCHLLTNDVFKLVKSEHNGRPVYSHGHLVYNIPSWKYGWSTAIRCYGDKLHLSCYITKYITKNSKAIFGKYYWSSRNIIREPEIVLTNNDFNGLDVALDFQTYEIKKAHLLFKYENGLFLSKE